MLAGAAHAQKPGGSSPSASSSISRFDPLKVGVYDTSTETAAAAIFDTLTTLDDKGEAQPKLALFWTHSDDFQDLDFSCGPASSSRTARRSTPEAVKAIRTGQKDPANKCRCAFYIAYITTCRRRRTDGGLQSERSRGELAGVFTLQSSNNVIHRRRRGRQGDDYNRIPSVPDRSPQSCDAGAALVLRKIRIIGTRERLSRPDRSEAAAGRAVALRQPAIGRGGYHLDDEVIDADNIQKAQKGPQDDGPFLCRLGRLGLRLQPTKVAPFDDVGCARRW